MSLADRVEALRRQHRREARPRGGALAGQPALHAGGRFARWHVPETVEAESDSWLLTYLDLITLLLAMLVVLLGVAKMQREPEPPAAPVELVGSLDAGAAASALRAALGNGLGEHDAPVIPAAWATAPEPRETPLAAQPSAPPADAAVADAPAAAAPPAPSIAELGLDDLGDGVDVIVNEKSISFRISNELLFPSGQAILSPSGLDVIQRMATVINRSRDYPVSVEGHSDTVPIQTRQFPSNWELSASRATSVLRALVRDGVDPARLRAVGYADTHPIAANDTAAGRAANRRVELIMEITPRRAAATPGPAPGTAAAGQG
ncbi:OmpA/MotB family protein [Bordetella petrii]|uniref:OmpA/MotB family protein n=1 Tax=Bordetella petrii TaxID=94624 RepID=UPI0004AD17DB|nr:OmpA family protein [Bordetella petrii]